MTVPVELGSANVPNTAPDGRASNAGSASARFRQRRKLKETALTAAPATIEALQQELRELRQQRHATTPQSPARKTRMTEDAFSYYLDDPDAFNVCQTRLLSDEASNFAVNFKAEQAHCRVNVGLDDLNTNHDALDPTNNLGECFWLNLWGWQPSHHDLVQAIASRYDVPPRLVHMLCPRPNDPPTYIPPVKEAANSSFSHAEDIEPASPEIDDAEEHFDADSGRKQLTSIADIANDLWHFFTVDFGPRYICIAWNALYFTGTAEISSVEGKPNATRIWSSLLLCDDGTVVSVFESPPSLTPRLRQRIRSNQLNVFRHLSRVYTAKAKQNALTQVTIRPDSGDMKQTPHDMASLIFYYLTDEWLNIYSQCTGARYSYRHQLEQLRERMSSSAEVDLVKTLHRVGKQLTNLKLVYKSYQAVVERLIDRHRRPPWQSLYQYSSRRRIRSRSSSRRIPPWNEELSGSQPKYSDDYKHTELRLTPASLARFERLLDRIEICALTEVDECLKEKEALVLMVCLPSSHCLSRPSLEYSPRHKIGS